MKYKFSENKSTKVDMANGSDLSDETAVIVILYSLITQNIIVIFIQIPWIIYLMVNIFQRERIVSKLVRDGIKVRTHI